MKIACQEGMTPGATLAEKWANLEKWGFEGIEFHGQSLSGEKVKEAVKLAEKSPVKPSSICAGYRGCPLDSDPAQRQQALSDCKELLAKGADLGGAGLIFVPIFGGPRLPDLSPLASAVELEKQLLKRILEELGEHAAKVGGTLLLEPLNRYETHLINRLEQGVEMVASFNNPHLKIMADFFHMSIEERNNRQAILAAGRHIGHVHLAESTRLLPHPDYGHTDFKTGFAALKEVGFGGYMALECGIPGDPYVELPKSLAYLKSCLPE